MRTNKRARKANEDDDEDVIFITSKEKEYCQLLPAPSPPPRHRPRRKRKSNENLFCLQYSNYEREGEVWIPRSELRRLRNNRFLSYLTSLFLREHLGTEEKIICPTHIQILEVDFLAKIRSRFNIQTGEECFIDWNKKFLLVKIMDCNHAFIFLIHIENWTLYIIDSKREAGWYEDALRNVEEYLRKDFMKQKKIKNKEEITIKFLHVSQQPKGSNDCVLYQSGYIESILRDTYTDFNKRLTSTQLFYDAKHVKTRLEVLAIIKTEIVKAKRRKDASKEEGNVVVVKDATKEDRKIVVIELDEIDTADVQDEVEVVEVVEKVEEELVDLVKEENKIVDDQEEDNDDEIVYDEEDEEDDDQAFNDILTKVDNDNTMDEKDLEKLKNKVILLQWLANYKSTGELVAVDKEEEEETKKEIVEEEEDEILDYLEYDDDEEDDDEEDYDDDEEYIAYKICRNNRKKIIADVLKEEAERKTEDEFYDSFRRGMLYRCQLCDDHGRMGPEHKQIYKNNELLEYDAEYLRNENLFYLSDFKNHVKLHGITAKTYRTSYDDPIDLKYASFHMCHICNERIILTNDKVRNHALKHNTTARDYIETHTYPLSSKLSVSVEKKRKSDCAKCLTMKARIPGWEFLLF